MRSAGILLHITSLPSPYGIGTLGKSAYEFVDFLKEAGQTYWQILPTNPTGFGNSPYQPLSSYAGNPYFIDLDMLVEDGLLKKKEITSIKWFKEETKVDFGLLYNNRFKVLKLACDRLEQLHPNDYFEFFEEEKSWLFDYATFMAIKDERNGESWTKWPQELRNHHSHEVKEKAFELKDSVLFYERLQYLFYKQMKKLKKYANDNHIKIIGDLPFYIAQDSSDVWVNPEQFDVDENFTMRYVSGFPDGQKWGNPLIDWNKQKESGYAWWIDRCKQAFKSCDVLRIDHFQGYHSYYAVPFVGESKDGHWVNGPGLEPFHKLEEVLGKKEIIIEDLGNLNDEFKNMIKESGYPGMRILEYAFDPHDPYSLYMPFQHERNSVCYTGTHDNNTIMGWFHDTNEKARIERVKEYLNIKNDKDFNESILKCAYGSVCDICIVQLQDILGLDENYRMNDPQHYESSWTYRCTSKDIKPKLSKSLESLMKLYGRYNWDNE